MMAEERTSASGPQDSEMLGPEFASVEPTAGVDAPGVQVDAAGALGIRQAFSAKQLRRVRDLLTRLYAARRAAQFYPLDHPATTDAMQMLQEVVNVFHTEGVDVALAFFEGELLFGDQLLPEESILFDQLIRDMEGIGVGSITFLRGLNVSELARAMALLGIDRREAEAAGGLSHLAIARDVVHVEIGEVKAFERSATDGEEQPELLRETYDSALDLLREIDVLLRKHRMTSGKHVKGVVRSLVDNVLSNRFAMLELTGLKNYDEYTFYHSANVAILSLALGSLVTTDFRFLSALGVGALLHDIGKMTVDPAIINKPGALSAEEWNLVRQHPIIGAEQAALIPGLDKAAIVIILEHHARYDSSGYPSLTTARPQHLASRIVAVADAYDAMTSQRSYSAARVQDQAMSTLLKSAGTAHDPALTRAFIAMMGVYPPRSVVRLSDGQTGIVTRPSETDPLKPRIKVIADSSGNLVEPGDIDLADAGLSVVRCLSAADLNIDVNDYIRADLSTAEPDLEWE